MHKPLLHELPRWHMQLFNVVVTFLCLMVTSPITAIIVFQLPTCYVLHMNCCITIIKQSTVKAVLVRWKMVCFSKATSLHKHNHNDGYYFNAEIVLRKKRMLAIDCVRKTQHFPCQHRVSTGAWQSTTLTDADLRSIGPWTNVNEMSISIQIISLEKRI